MTTMCSIEGCKNKASRKNDWCNTHYDRYIRTGDPHSGTKNDLWEVIKAEMPGEARAIAEKLGVPIRTVTRWMRKMRDATPKQVYVSKWRPPTEKGRHVPTYALGNKPDVECDLGAKSYKLVYKDWRAKLIKTGKIHDERAKWRARYYVKRATKKQNTWLGALGVR